MGGEMSISEERIERARLAIAELDCGMLQFSECAESPKGCVCRDAAVAALTADADARHLVGGDSGVSYFPQGEVVADLSIAVFGPPSKQVRVRQEILNQDEPWKVAVLTATVAAVLDPIGGFRLAGILSGAQYPETVPPKVQSEGMTA
jgi:hypothetical protein